MMKTEKAEPLEQWYLLQQVLEVRVCCQAVKEAAQEGLLSSQDRQSSQNDLGKG